MTTLKENDSKKNKKLRSRRTNEQREEHITFAKKLLDLDVPTYAIALQLSARFGLCRSSAYRDIAIASDERASAEDGGLQASLPVMQMRDTLVSILFQSVLDASVDGDAKTLPRLTKEIRELMKLGGPGAGKHPDDVDVHEEQVLSQIQYLFNKRKEIEEAQAPPEATTKKQGGTG